MNWVLTYIFYIKYNTTLDSLHLFINLFKKKCTEWLNVYKILMLHQARLYILQNCILWHQQVMLHSEDEFEMFAVILLTNKGLVYSCT